MMKKYLIFLLGWQVFLCCGSGTKHHLLMELSENWYFQIDPEKKGETEGWYAPNVAYKTSAVQMPWSNWDHLVGTSYDGIGWFFCEFNCQEGPDKVALSFAGVDDEAKVWLNSRYIGQYKGANEPFKLDVNEIILKEKNFLAIAVTDHGGPGGLTGPVNLISYSEPEDLLKGEFFDRQSTPYPEWAKNAVLYEVNLRQYTRDGTFNAFAKHLPQLKDLGVNIIWFMPIHPIGDINRKGSLGSYYSVKNYYGVNSEFGTLEDFRNIVRQIHQAGMFVILDLVANHTAWDNPMIESHPEWYTHNDNGDIIAPVDDWSDVADLNYDNPELRKYMIDMLQYWIREFDIDGYRCDVAAMVPMDFWQQACKACNDIKPVFMLAEAEAPECHVNGFHMTYASPVYWLFNEIARGTAPASAIDEKLRREYYNFPKKSIFMRFTCNHDQNSWHGSAIERYGREGAKAFAVLTVALPGMPMLYSGQEIGLANRLSFFEKDPIIWQENEFRPFYKTLFQAFHQHPALHDYHTKLTKLTSTEDAKIYAAALAASNDRAFVIINLCGEIVECEIDFTGNNGNFTEVFTNTVFPIPGKKTKIRFEPWEYRLYVK